MKTDGAWILGGILLVAGVGIAHALHEESACRAPIKNGSRVLVIGDSMARGLDPFLKSFCTTSGADYLFLENPAVQVMFRAIGSFGPSHVLVITRDQNQNVAVGLIESIRNSSADTNLIWIVPPAPPGIGRIIPQLNARVIDNSKLVVPFGPDGVHPTVRGFAGWGEYVWSVLTCHSVQVPPPQDPGMDSAHVVPPFMKKAGTSTQAYRSPPAAGTLGPVVRRSKPIATSRRVPKSPTPRER